MKKNASLPLILWGVLVAGILFVVFSYLLNDTRTYHSVSYSTFREAADSGGVHSLVIKGKNLKGSFTEAYAKEKGIPKTFLSYGPLSDSLQNELANHHTIMEYEKVDDDSFGSWIPFFLFSILIVGFVFFMFRQMTNSSKKAMAFGESRAKLLHENKKVVTFADIAGIEEAKDELQEVVEFLREPSKYTRLGGRIPRGVLLLGQPGTGKTLLARGVAGEARVPFFSLSGSDFVEMFIGVGASRVRDLFAQAKKHSPCIVFIDEIDAIGRRRGGGNFNQNEEREQTLNQLLVEMDGFEPNENVIIIAATNRPDTLDPALTRPGRFDRRVHVPAPDARGREAILKIHTRKTPLTDDIDLKSIAKGTPGFVGADLENLVNEAALQAARLDKSRISTADFEFAKDKILMGKERRSAVMTEESRRVTAFHEAGHALVALMQRGTDPVHKISIIPRGRALGVTQQLPDEDRYATSRDFALKKIAVMMGGRAAEHVVFGQRTTGAGNDIEVATDLAHQMVCAWGMSDKIGPIAYHGSRSNPFGYGSEEGYHPYSESTAQLIDAEVATILREANAKAESILEEHRELLDVFADALMEFETLDREEINLLIKTHSAASIRQHRDKIEREEAEKRKEYEAFQSARSRFLGDDPTVDLPRNESSTTQLPREDAETNDNKSDANDLNRSEKPSSESDSSVIETAVEEATQHHRG